MAEDSYMYLDVGVDRIQGYLTRTPKLKGLRGASAWLSHTTDRRELASWVRQAAGDGVEVNEQAGEADGVVPLRLLAEVDPEPVARAVMAELRARLPAGDFSARWFRGPTYVDGYRTSRPLGHAVSLPAPNEFPALKSCHSCRADPWVDVIDLPGDGRTPVCADCAERFYQHRRRPGLERDWVPVRAESHLLLELQRLPKDAATHFDELAKLGDDESRRNHLATICADGNAMGELFGRVAASGDARAKAEVSRAVSNATRTAWWEAAREIIEQADGERIAVIPHIAGGDDLTVSVVANRAWLFVRTFLNRFAALLGAEPVLAPHIADGAAPSASAGVVFAHAKFPFPRTTELAQDLLKEAKKNYAGTRGAVAWLDVTREGSNPPRFRRPWLLTELEQADGSLRELRKVDASGKAVLERIIDPGRPVVSMARLRNHARRLERASLLDPFLDGGGDDEQRAARVLDALSLARWWR